jgi:hypothetical protein
MLAPGPLTVALCGVGAVYAVAVRSPKEFLNDPAMRPARLAFSYIDRIRTGEISPECALCNSRTPSLSVVAVVDRALGEVTDKPAVLIPVCRRCDSGTEETRRRVYDLLGVIEIQAGHA